MLYFTIISREKLKRSCSDPDSSHWNTSQKEKLTSDVYYQPAIELLDSILKKNNKQD